MHPFAPAAVLWLLAFSSLTAQTAMCAPTPETAAAGAFTAAGPLVSYALGTGYRVQDVIVDPLTKHVWVRVRRCDSDSAPALLVPMRASLGSPVSQVIAGDAGLPAALASEISSVMQRPAPPRMIAVQPGDAIRVVMEGPLVHLEVEGKALQQAAVGESIEVELRRVPDEPVHRMLGTLRAGHTVEVQP